MRSGLAAGADLEAVVVEVRSSICRGSFPGQELPSRVLALSGDEDALARRLRQDEPQVLGRIEQGQLLLDLRTVLPEHDVMLLQAIRIAQA